MPRRRALLPLVALAALLAPALLHAQSQGAATNIVALDFVKAKPGELARLVRFYELNWAAARATVKAQQVGVLSYRLLIRADTVAGWDVMLETVYADSAAYARREEIFRPVLQAKGRLLVDGKDRGALGDIVESRVLGLPVVGSRE